MLADDDAKRPPWMGPLLEVRRPPNHDRRDVRGNATRSRPRKAEKQPVGGGDDDPATLLVQLLRDHRHSALPEQRVVVEGMLVILILVEERKLQVWITAKIDLEQVEYRPVG